MPRFGDHGGWDVHGFLAQCPSLRQDMSLGQVQRWVLWTLTVFPILHMSGGLIFASLVLDMTDAVERVGLGIIAGLFGVVAIAAGVAIHRHRLLAPGSSSVIPIAIGLRLVLRQLPHDPRLAH